MEPDLPTPQLTLRRGATIDFVPRSERELHLERLFTAHPALNPGTVFVKTSAAVLHGLPLWGEDLTRVHAMWLYGGHGKENRVAKGYRCTKRPPVVTTVSGLPTTTLARTAADLMRCYRFGPALAVADAALRLGASREELLRESAGGRGCRIATEASRRADALSESPYESLSRGLMLQKGTPLPTLQATFTDALGVIRVDFWWPRFKLVGEFDGEVKLTELCLQGRTPEQAIAAREERDARLRALGQQVLHWGASDVHAVNPLVTSLSAALGDVRVDHGLCPEAMDYKRPPRPWGR